MGKYAWKYTECYTCIIDITNYWICKNLSQSESLYKNIGDINKRILQCSYSCDRSFTIFVCFFCSLQSSSNHLALHDSP